MIKQTLLALLTSTSIAVADDFNDYAPDDFNIEISNDPATMFYIAVMDLDIGNDETKQILYYEGVITHTTTDTIAYFKDKYPDITEISLSSAGGAAWESFKLGEWLSDNEMTTTVSPGRICMSACAYAFVGGSDYKIDGLLGFHASWVDIPEVSIATSDQVNAYYLQGQAIGSYLTSYMMLNGFHSQLGNAMPYITDQENFWVFKHEDELMKFYVRNDDSQDLFANYFQEIEGIGEENYVIMSGEKMENFLNTREDLGRGRPVVNTKIVFPFFPPDAYDPRN
ncbi:MAG: hypothetical protein N0C84_00615 [Candidatus Thiodiazotropha taylori]|uniref:Uncharacterized protein n=1 Tax=Candidatus Thiodiazotropha taylori TaxID=2792791 RepID=A0A9E4N2J1_9GAMM|nr:hypothetical protein [Candidatus Thiodiazotropha taylori]MCW4254947.1 hypothetical protein [Candidatus Thiodiazotropha taylori]